uniref:Cystatin n=1 Tax=Rhipicephalus appendiculatus TaxID=34631 RepID=A0A131YBI6_RHIAP
MGWLLSSCDESFGASGWTEVRNPDTYTNRALAEFAYGEKKRYRSGGLTFLVTQARHKYQQGTEYQIGFIVYQNGLLIEKCITKIFTPPIGSLQRRKIVTKFWCR